MNTFYEINKTKTFSGKDMVKFSINNKIIEVADRSKNVSSRRSGLFREKWPSGFLRRAYA